MSEVLWWAWIAGAPVLGPLLLVIFQKRLDRLMSPGYQPILFLIAGVIYVGSLIVWQRGKDAEDLRGREALMKELSDIKGQGSAIRESLEKTFRLDLKAPLPQESAAPTPKPIAPIQFTKTELSPFEAGKPIAISIFYRSSESVLIARGTARTKLVRPDGSDWSVVRRAFEKTFWDEYMSDIKRMPIDPDAALQTPVGESYFSILTPLPTQQDVDDLLLGA